MKLCFATNNKHKLEEVQNAVGDSIEIISLSDLNYDEELPETRDTLEGNSLQKAEFIYHKFNIPCFADDSGLEVAALNNAPGVYSARYAGEHKNSNDNVNLLLKNLQDSSIRRAQFRTVITLVTSKSMDVFEGRISGIITHTPRGTNGFGYDPVFQPDGFDKTFAELSLQEKNKFSHRAIAVAKLVHFLKQKRS